MTQEYKSFSPEESRPHNKRLRAGMEKQDIDMLLLSTPENTYYSASYRSWHTSNLFRPAYVLVSGEGDPTIILRVLEKITVQYTSWISRTYYRGIASRDLGSLESAEPVSIIGRIIKEIRPDTRTAGLEAGDGMQYFWSMGLLKKIIDSQPDIRLTDGSPTIQRARMVKTSWEIERTRRVYRITEKVILDTEKAIVVGEITERDISKGIATRMAQGGVDRISYLIVISSIDKHCTFSIYATGRVVQEGGHALVDTSSHIDGYASDLTRAFHLGTVPWEKREMAETASGYVMVVREAMKPGVSIADVSRICEGYTWDSRLGKLLLHLSGHCTGFNVVEYPIVHDEAGERLKPDMVFAVGNGVYPYDLGEGTESIYLSFWIEDEVPVTENGAERITGPGKPVIEVGVDKQINSTL